MTDRERRQKERADRVQNFFDFAPDPAKPTVLSRRIAFDPASKTTARLVEFDGLLGTGGTQGLIDQSLARQQAGSASGGADAKSAIAVILRDDLAAIIGTAAEAEDEMPGIAAKFPAPANGGYTALRTAVLTALENLTPEIKTALIAEELDDTFDDELRQDLADFDNARDDEDTALDTQVRGTESLGRLLDRTGALVRKFHVAVSNKFKRDPETLRAWAVPSKLERAPVRKPATPASPAAPGK